MHGFHLFTLVRSSIFVDLDVDPSLEHNIFDCYTINTNKDRDRTILLRRIGDGECASNGIEGTLVEQDRKRSDNTRTKSSTTHVTLYPDCTSHFGRVYNVGGSVGTLLDTVGPELVVLVTAIRQNCRSEQETGHEG